MRKISILFSLIFVFSISSFSQQKNVFYSEKNQDLSPVNQVKDKSLRGVDFNYQFKGFSFSEITHEDVKYNEIRIPGFSHTKLVGKPAMPAHNDIIAVPQAANAEIIIKSTDTDEFNNFYVYPALKPEHDYVGAEEAEFEIDEDFYQRDIYYPRKPVKIVDTLTYRGVNMLIVRITPIQFNPAKKKLRVIKDIDYEVNFSGGNKFIDAQNHTERALKILKNSVLNTKGIEKDISSAEDKRGVYGPSKNYILVTKDDYLDAADSLAQWKRQLGYTVEVVSSSSWSAANVLNEVHTRYSNWTPKPDFLSILGDHQDVPAQVMTTNGNTFASDLYYVCMDGSSDYVPDMAKGRISVSNSSEAMDVVKKIIEYEKNPPSNSSFYNTGLNAAYFQESSTSGYAERRFAQTSEDVRDYMTNSIGMNVERVYYTESSVNPTNWNDGNYSDGEPLPLSLQKPQFAWDGNDIDINNGINNGRLFLLHRDHGYENGWGDPAYDISDINSLSNGDQTPIVFSINCLTGKFLESVCFSEAFLRKSSGGAAGVFCHAEVSYSGYNDGLALGLFDAIWANPGLVPNFTGSGHTTGNLTPHSSIYEMGNVANQGLIRMIETWGNSQYTHELFHYLGDPAMKIWTAAPTQITASHDTVIDCNDNSFNVTNASVPDGLATLVINGQMIASTQLSGGNGTLNFSSIAGNYAYLTVSKHNYQPYVAVIPITGGCPLADFEINPIQDCGTNNLFEFEDMSMGNINSYSWNFDSGATPSTASGNGPHQVSYSTWGMKEIELIVDGPAGSDTMKQSINVQEYCTYTMPNTGSQTIDECVGKLYDNGGQSNYTNDLDVITTIEPLSATSITLDFVNFDIEPGSGSFCDYDYLEIFDGPDTTATSLGKYCNTTGSPGMITSSSGAITLYLHADQYVNEAGFEVIFNCAYPNQSPVADFELSDTTTCTGLVSFNDISLNGPSSWLWDFGDGQTSTNQNPTHQYQTNGTYDITLYATNSYGTDTLTMTNHVTVNMPSKPLVSDQHSCTHSDFNFTASGSGTINWYDAASGGTLLDTGSNYSTSIITTTQTFYVENLVEQPSMFFSNTNNTSDGDYLTYEHFLVFDCFESVILKSVEVNANTAGQRTIELRNSSGLPIVSKDIYIPAGISRIDLDFTIPVGTDLQLACTGSPDLFRNSSNLNYPYTLPGYLEIKHSSASSDPTGYYYYFYDWEVKAMPCKSPRVPVNAYIHNVNANINPDGNIQLCEGDSIQITADSSANYLWYPGGQTSKSIIVNQEDSVYVEVYDSICSSISPAAVIDYDSLPDAGFSLTNNDPSVEFLNETVYGDSYYWDFGDSTVSTDINPVHVYQSNGTYTVTLIAENNCGTDTISKTFDIVNLSYNASQFSANIECFPNPAEDYVNINYNSSAVLEEIKLRDITGRIIYSDNTLQTKTFSKKINIKDLSEGVYSIVFKTNKGEKVRKLIIQ